MLVVVAAAAILIEPDQEGSLRLALRAAVTYTSNWYQVLHHVSYFGSLGPPPPLEHLWSLAIEEQFYIVWPVVLRFFIFKLNGPRTRVTATLIAASRSALALVGAALALAYPRAAWRHWHEAPPSKPACPAASPHPALIPGSAP